MLRRRLKEPFGKAGLTVAILALVFAMVGGAYAAGGLSKSQEKQVTKIAKKYAGKPGAAGAQGTPGTSGSQGTPGANGTGGKAGTDGTSGKSVVSTAFTGANEPAGEPCHAQGGTKLEVEGSGTQSFACNGNPAAYPEFLPSGKTERGAWDLSTTAGAPPVSSISVFSSPVSFPIPLEGSLNELHVHYVAGGQEIIKNKTQNPQVNEEVPSTACTGTPEAPTAAPGNLCVYQKFALGVKPATEQSTEFNIPATNVIPAGKFGGFFGEENGAAPFGFLLQFLLGESPNHTTFENGSLAMGSWAVTAE